MDTFFIVLAVLAGIGMHWLMFRAFFEHWESYLEAWDFFVQPDWVSAFDGDYETDRWFSFKLVIYHTFCIGTGVFVYYLLSRFRG